MQLDHIIIATTDLTRSARDLASRTGLTAIEGGVHDGLGTRNYIVPLGRAYLELVAVHDRELAQANDFGRLVLSGLRTGDDAFAGWAVEVDPDELETRADERGLDVGRLTRRGVGIRHIGMTQALVSPGLPFLLARDANSAHPAEMAAAHRVAPMGVPTVTIGETQADLDTWLMRGTAELPVVCAADGRGITAVTIDTAAGAVTLTADHPIGRVRA